MENTKKPVHKRGQNTAEYLIMLTLVVVGSIGLVTAFGKTIQSKFAYLSAAISGDTTAYTNTQTLTTTAATDAYKKAQTESKIKVSGVDSSELTSTDIK